MKINDLLENQTERAKPLYVAYRDFDLIPNTEYKGYVMGDDSIDDDDGFTKIGFMVYKFAKTTDFEWNGQKRKQDHYERVTPLVDPRTKQSPSPYGRLGQFTEDDLDLFLISDRDQRRAKLGKPITYEDIYRYTVDALEDGLIEPWSPPMISEEMQVATPQTIDYMFGPELAKELSKHQGTSIMFTKDKEGRNWKVMRTTDGTIRIERDHMLEGDVLMLEGKTEAVAGTIVSIKDDVIILEGSLHPFDESEMQSQEHDYSDLEPETDTSTMPHRDHIMAISREIYYLLHDAIDVLPMDTDHEELELHDEENNRDLMHWDAEAEKIGYVPAMDLISYPFVDLHWYHVPTHRLFTIHQKDLKQDQSYRNIVNEEPMDEGLGKLVGTAALAALLGLGANQLLDPGATERTPLGQAMAAAAAKGDDYAARELKNLRLYFEAGDHEKIAALNDTYLHVKEADGDRRSFTVTVKFNDGGKATRVFLARDRDDALGKAKSWATKEMGKVDIDAKVVAEATVPTKKISKREKQIMEFAMDAMWNWVAGDLESISNTETLKALLGKLRPIFDKQIPILARQGNTARLRDASRMLELFGISLAKWNQMLEPFKNDILSSVEKQMVSNPGRARLSLLSLLHADLGWPEIAKLAEKAKKLDMQTSGGEDVRSTWHVTPQEIMAIRNKMAKPTKKTVVPPTAGGKPQLTVVKEQLRATDIVTDPLGNEEMDRKEILNIIKKKISTLSDREQLAIEMWLDGSTQKEIGDAFGISGTRSAQIVRKAMHKISSHIYKKHPEFYSDMKAKRSNYQDLLNRVKAGWHLLTKDEKEAIKMAVGDIYAKYRYDRKHFATAWKKLYKHIPVPTAERFYYSIVSPAVSKATKDMQDAGMISTDPRERDWKNEKEWLNHIAWGELKQLREAEYKGRTVKLGKPMAGDVKKYKVYVKDPKTGNVKKVNFGDKGMEIKRDDPKRRKNFRARHGCGTPRASNRTKAAYWSCRMWSSKPVSKILKGK